MGRELCNPSATQRNQPVRSAFTILELAVSIGIVMILMGLLLPSLRQARKSARATLSTVTIADHAKALQAYANDFRGVFPFTPGHPVTSSQAWWRIMAHSGHVTGSSAAVDPEGNRAYGNVGYALSIADVYSPELMTPGKTIEYSSAKASPQRWDSMFAPSAKAIIFRFWVAKSDGTSDFWCCAPGDNALPGEIAFGDGSAGVYRWGELLVNGVPTTVENSIGYPVVSTWYGLRGRDRN